MAWITLAEPDFLAALSAPERTALDQAATAAGQTSPLAEVASTTIGEIRARVAAHPRNRLGPGHTIPSELRQHAIDLVRYRATLRLPGVRILQDDARRLAYQDALRGLEAVANGKLAIEQPPAPLDADLGSVPPPRTTPPRTSFNRTAQNGS